jgi:hypothetical protein
MLGFGEGLTAPHRTKLACYEMSDRSSDWTETLERPKQRKIDMRLEWVLGKLVGRV